jgi:hypothetical protein
MDYAAHRINSTVHLNNLFFKRYLLGMLNDEFLSINTAPPLSWF